MKQRKHKQRYAIGEVVTTDFEDVPRAITGANWNGLTWMYSFEGSDMSCGEGYLNVHTQPKDQSKEVKEGGEGFTGGEWEPSATFHQMRSHLNGNITLICSFDNQMDDTQANAALIAQSKNMYYALKDIIGVLDPLSHNPVHSSLMDKAIDILKKANPNY